MRVKKRGEARIKILTRKVGGSLGPNSIRINDETALCIIELFPTQKIEPLFHSILFFDINQIIKYVMLNLASSSDIKDI